MDDGYHTHLFTYSYNDATWGIEIVAKNEQEARERISRLTWARYDGVVVAKVPASLGIFARAAVFFNRLFRGTSNDT